MNCKPLRTVTFTAFIACVGFGSENTVLAADSIAVLPPTNPTELGALLTTRYNNAENYDYWHCKNESRGTDGYWLMPEKGVLADDSQQGLDLTAPGEKGGNAILLEATTASSFKIKYPDVGLSLKFTDVVFLDANSMKNNNTIAGQFTCERNSFGAAPPISAPSTTDDSKQSVTTLSTPSQIEDLHSMFGYIVRNKGYAVLAFNDGTYSKDMALILNKGIKESRANNPKLWGTWRGTAKSLELKSWNDTNYDELNWSFKVQPGSSDQKLDRCYSKVSGSQAQNDYDSGLVISSVYCFYENGRFTNSSAVWSQAPLGDFGAVNPEKIGQYKISGHVAELLYNSGRSVKFAFGFTDKDRNLGSIYLNGHVYLD